MNHVSPIGKPSALRPVLAFAIVLFMSVTAFAQTISPDSPLDKGLTQGGLLAFSLALGWSYRKDLTKWAEAQMAQEKRHADERVTLERQLADLRSSVVEEKIAFQQARIDEALRYSRMLEAMMKQTQDTMKVASDSMNAHTVGLVRNTDSTDRLAHAVEQLDQRIEREHRE